MPRALGSFEVVLCDATHAIAVAAPLLVQVRRGDMTAAALEEIERRVREVRGRLATPGQRVGLISVLEAGVRTPSDEVRARQRRLIETSIHGLDARIAAVVLGDGITAMLQRTIARGVLFANPRVRIARAPEEAAAWIGPHLEVPEADVAQVVARTRALR